MRSLSRWRDLQKCFVYKQKRTVVNIKLIHEVIHDTRNLTQEDAAEAELDLQFKEKLSPISEKSRKFIRGKFDKSAAWDTVNEF